MKTPLNGFGKPQARAGLPKKPKQKRPKPLQIGRLLRTLMGESVGALGDGNISSVTRAELYIRHCVAAAANGNVQAAATVLKWLQGDTRDLEFNDPPIEMTEKAFVIAKASGRVPKGASVRKNGKEVPETTIEDALRIHPGMNAREAMEIYSAMIAGSHAED